MAVIYLGIPKSAAPVVAASRLLLESRAPELPPPILQRPAQTDPDVAQHLGQPRMAKSD